MPMTTSSADINKRRRSRPVRRHTVPPGRSPGAAPLSAAAAGRAVLKSASSLTRSRRLVATHALAHFGLADPAGLDDDVEVAPGDRHRREKPRLKLNLLCLLYTSDAADERS